MPNNPYATAASHAGSCGPTATATSRASPSAADGTLWSVEHGSFRDDEVNRLVPGGDYGWNPVPGYNESVPMTDQSLPGRQQEAAWSSGDPTIATSGATWVRGSQWGSLEGTLAVAVLKDSEMIFLRFDDAGAVVSVVRPQALAPVRPAPLGHVRPQRRPAGHHRQRHGRPGAAGLAALTAASGRVPQG